MGTCIEKPALKVAGTFSFGTKRYPAISPRSIRSAADIAPTATPATNSVAHLRRNLRFREFELMMGA
jgi:hypothetical protein